MEYTARDVFAFGIGMIVGVAMSIGMLILAYSNLFGYVGK
jgi:hypothetical protein